MSRKQKKPKFNPKKNMYELLRMLSEEYGMYDDRVDEFHNPSLNALAKEYGLNVIKVRKILITSGVYSTEVSRLIYELNSQGLSISEIVEQTGLSKSSVNSYLPYHEYAYNLPEVSVDADRSKLYRSRKSCVNQLQTEMSERSLWNAIIVFQEYPFHTVGKNLPFKYKLKIGREGTYNKELIINRRKESKTLAWSSVRLAFNNIKKMGKIPIVKRAKDRGDIRGISYIYAIFLRFGIIGE